MIKLAIGQMNMFNAINTINMLKPQAANTKGQGLYNILSCRQGMLSKILPQRTKQWNTLYIWNEAFFLLAGLGKWEHVASLNKSKLVNAGLLVFLDVQINNFNV